MRIVRLAGDRIKVFLSGSDLSGMNIDIGSLSPTSPGLDRFLSEVLDAVKAETGFSASDGQVIAEASHSGGGLVLLLSHPKEIVHRGERVVFELSGFESLSGLLKNVSPGYLALMRLYEKDGLYYLAVPLKRVPPLIYEFSLKNRKSDISESSICEHGTFLAGGYKLLCMARALKKIN